MALFRQNYTACKYFEDCKGNERKPGNPKCRQGVYWNDGACYAIDGGPEVEYSTIIRDDTMSSRVCIFQCKDTMVAMRPLFLFLIHLF